mgnify:CR=1 FL=1|tara:strand:+ start:291 stop:857 length:567 start_codon:yes stop_codon:yes gene_type:complete
MSNKAEKMDNKNAYTTIDALRDRHSHREKRHHGIVDFFSQRLSEFVFPRAMAIGAGVGLFASALTFGIASLAGAPLMAGALAVAGTVAAVTMTSSIAFGAGAAALTYKSAYKKGQKVAQSVENTLHVIADELERMDPQQMEEYFKGLEEGVNKETKHIPLLQASPKIDPKTASTQPLLADVLAMGAMK